MVFLEFKLYQIHLVGHELIREMGVNSSDKTFRTIPHPRIHNIRSYALHAGRCKGMAQVINNLLLNMINIYPLIPATESRDYNNVLEVLRYINQNFREDLSLPKLAKHFNYSPKYFSDFFKRNIGCTLTEYLHNVRIKNVLLQMETSDQKTSLSALAFDNGFKSLATFYRVLKQYQQQIPNYTINS